MEAVGAQEQLRSFIGEHRHTLDPKGRLILPAAFRRDLADGLVMSVGEENCITVYPQDFWQNEMLHSIRGLPKTDARARMYARMVTSSAHPEVPDNQGRVTIPPRLRSYAGLSKDVTVVGADSHLEIWDSTAWDEYLAEAQQQFSATDQPFNSGML